MYSAQIVESHRAGGKPRQKVALQLGSIYAHELRMPFARAAFWDLLPEKLSLGVWLPPARRQAILSQMAELVPRPTPTEWGRYRRLRRRQRSVGWDDQLYWLHTRAGFRIARRQRHVLGPGVKISPRQHQTLEALWSFQRREGRPLSTAEWRRAATRSGVPSGSFWKARQALIRKEVVRQV